MKKPRRSKNLVSLIKHVVDRKAETKMAMYFGGQATDATRGTYAQAAAAPQNQFISNNVSDILRVIPFVAEGTDTYQRIGSKINPVSLRIHCSVGINPSLMGTQYPASTGTTPGLAANFYAVAYLLQHKEFKTYVSLSTQNNFAQLLDSGDGSTRQFNGTWQDSRCPVTPQYYQLIKKKVIPLRAEGASGVGSAIPGTTLCNGLSSPFQANWTWNLKAGKHFPKKLTYPESNTAGTGVGATLNDPTNSSLFWSVAFFRMDHTPLGGAGEPNVWIQQQYVSELRYKDT